MWCLRWKPYTKSDYGKVDNRTVLEMSDDAARANWGGSWIINASSCRVSRRDYYAPDYRNGNLGFRVVLFP